MPNLKVEQIHVEQFTKLLLCSDIRAIQQKPPEPDFKIIVDERIIGIEHTQLIKLPDKKGIDFMAHSKIADKIIQKAESLYNQKQNMCLMIHVKFRCDYNLNCNNPIRLYNNDIEELSLFIANFILLQLPLIESSENFSYLNYETYDVDSLGQILPEKIDHISITNTKNFKHSCWTANQSAIITEFSDSIEFKTIIEKKNTKPSKYKNKYDELWLLIVEDSMDLTSYFDFEHIGQAKITSTFNNVFILRRAENEVIKINVCN